MAVIKKKFLDIIRRNIGGKRTTVFFKTYKLKSSGPFKEVGLVKAFTAKGRNLGMQDFDIPWHGKHMNIIDTNVINEARGQGIAHELFKRTIKAGSSEGKRFVRSQEILSPKQISVRKRFRSKFLGYGLGKYGEGTAILSPKQAKDIINSSKTGRYVGSVRGSTMIPKNINKPKNIRIRVRGRWLTIKRRK